MTAGMAMVAGTVMVLYATILAGIIPNPIGQILSAVSGTRSTSCP